MFVPKLWSGRYSRLSQNAYLDEAPGEEKGADLTTSLRCMQILNFAGLLLLALVFGSVGFAVGRNYPSTADLVSRPDDVVPQGSKTVAEMKAALTRDS